MDPVVELLAPCRCQCIRSAHKDGEGACESCRCPEYRRVGHAYPIGSVVTS